MMKKSYLFLLPVLLLASCKTNDSFSLESSQFSSNSIISYSSLEEGEMWDSSQDYLRTGKKTLSFYNLNDFHGATEYYSDSREPGINLLSSYLLNEKAKNPNGFVLTSSGDMWQGSADSNLSKGGLVIDWMNYLNFNAQAIGNHEFDWTINTIEENETKMNFPMLASNIIDNQTGKPVDWVKPYTTLTRNGIHIGIIGAIGEGQTSSITSKNVKGLTFDDPTSYVNKWADYLKDNGADVILYLIHDSIYSVDYSTALKVDAIFGGHSHSGEADSIKGKPAVQAYSNGKDVGYITLSYDFSKQNVSSYYCEILDTRSFKIESLGEDQYTKNLYDSYLNSPELAIKNNVVGYTQYGIDKYDIPALYDKYAYQYYNDNDDLEYDISFVESNNARSSIPKGNITYGGVYKALPFDNTLVLCSSKGSFIKNTLRHYESATFWNPSTGSTMDSSELSYYDSNTTYYFLVIDYIISYEAYGNNYTIIKTYDDESALPRNIFARYVSLDYPIK